MIEVLLWLSYVPLLSPGRTQVCVVRFNYIAIVITQERACRILSQNNQKSLIEHAFDFCTNTIPHQETCFNRQNVQDSCALFVGIGSNVVLARQGEEIMGIFTSKQSQAPDPRIVELTQLVRESAAAITILEKEIEVKNGIIERNKYMWQLNEKDVAEMTAQLHAAAALIEEYKKQEAALIDQIYRLRAELKKRTDQYNDLVDLAREKGVIGE